MSDQGNRNEQKPALLAQTVWTVVLQAGQNATAAFGRLYQTYRQPVYIHLRYRGCSHDDAEDLTQAFFEHLLSKGNLAKADPARGRFRNFLFRSLENFVENERAKATAQKRGGNNDAVSFDDPNHEELANLVPDATMDAAQIWDFSWAKSTLEVAMKRLRQYYAKNGNTRVMEKLEPFLDGADQTQTYKELAREMDVTEQWIKTNISRMRDRYVAMIKEEIAQTLENPDDGEVEQVFQDMLHTLRR